MPLGVSMMLMTGLRRLSSRWLFVLALVWWFGGDT